MDQEGQKKLASLALVGLAVLGSVLVAWSGRTQPLLTMPGSTLGSLSRNRGSLGSIGSIGAPEAACKLCCLLHDLLTALFTKVLPAPVRILSLYKLQPTFCVHAGSIGSYYSIGASLLQAVLQVMRFNKAQGLRLLHTVACV